MLEEIGVLSKKFMFPGMLIVVGIMLIISGQSVDPVTGISQTGDFILGAYAILGAGVISLLYMMEVINKIVNLVLLLVLFVVTGIFAMKSYNSIQITIAQRNAKEAWDVNTIQALSDIRDVQMDLTKKTKGFFASDYTELKRFLKEEKVMDRIIKGDIKDRRLTLEEGKILGYKMPKDEDKYAEIDEEEAVLLEMIFIDTIYYPIMEVMFTGEQAIKKNEGRLYDFTIEGMGALAKEYLPTVEGYDYNLEYPMYTDTLREEEDLISHLYIYDPKPYDPFVKRDTLSIGSKTETKTNGSWAEK